MKIDKKYVSALLPISKNMRSISIPVLYSIFEALHTPTFYFDGECHSPWEMVYVIDGEVGVTANNQVHTLLKGDVIFHKPMEFHKIWNETSGNIHVLICSFDLEGTLAHKLRNGIYHLNQEQTQNINLLIEHLHSSANIYNEEKKGLFHHDYGALLYENHTAMQLVLNYLELILLSLSGSDKKNCNTAPNRNMLLYTEITKILEEHVFDKITIPEIAAICNVSASTIKNCFSVYTGCGIHKYFLNIKIRTAIKLLKDGKSVSEVSDMLQFANSNYFSYVFKRETGMCASIYKK